MTTWLIQLCVLLMLNPLFPLGRNPSYGDPFIIINKQNNKLAFVNEGKIQATYPVATGKTNALTPEGMFNVVIKAKDPYYIKGNIPGGDSKNPLGSRWIGMDALNTDGTKYGIHGTNAPSSIGTYASNGCIRMNNVDVEKLYAEVPVGTRVWIVKSKQTFLSLAREKKVIK